MTSTREKRVGLTLAAAGAAVMGAAVVFGLTTDAGAVDWVEVVVATLGLLMVLIGLITLRRPGTPHPG